MKKFVITLITVIVIAGGAIAGIYYYAQMKLDEPLPSDGEIMVRIPQNSSQAEIIKIFNKMGIFTPEWMFEWIIKGYTRLEGRHIQAGYYKFPANMTNRSLLDALMAGKHVYTISVTFPEGRMIGDYASISQAELKADSTRFMKMCRSHSLLSKFNISTDDLEGYLLPDTYKFYPDADAKDVIERMLAAQRKFWTKERFRRASRFDMSRHEVLTLASIIEAETSVPSERERISGVYHNRLDRGMLLQADPTVQYAIGEKRRVLYRDLESTNPYNTYVYSGLPPGPINCPGRDAINAALNPERHDYLYFVAVGDGTGRHNFAKNSAQHARYVAEYRQKARARRNN